MYEYYVVVVWDHSPAPESNSDRGYTSIAPTSPTAVEWSMGTYGKPPWLLWEDVPGATHYGVRQLESQTGSAVLRMSTDSPELVLEGFGTCSGRRWYDVTACNECGCSGPSDPVAVELPALIPRRPTWLSPTSGFGSCTAELEWREDSSADYFEVRYCTQPERLYRALGEAIEPHFTVASPGLPECMSRWDVSVRGCNCHGCSEWSVPTFIDWGGSDLAAPSDLEVALAWTPEAGEGVALTWGSVPGADFYRVFAWPTAPDVLNMPPDWAGTQTGSEIFGSYYCEPVYWVQGCCSCGCGDLADVQASAGSSQSSVSGVRATDGSFPDTVTISWVPGPGHRTYEVYRQVGDGDYALIAEHVDKDFYLDVSVVPCQTYSYAVRGCNACGCGPLSEPDPGYAGLPRCIPEVWVWSYNDGSPIRIEWRGCADSSWHQLVRTDLENGSQEMIAELTLPHGEEAVTHFYDDTPPKPRVMYEYAVEACNECGCRRSFAERGEWRPRPP
jgi:hypothetical protein